MKKTAPKKTAKTVKKVVKKTTKRSTPAKVSTSATATKKTNAFQVFLWLSIIFSSILIIISRL